MFHNRGIKGTVVNRTLQSLNGMSPESTSFGPLNELFLIFNFEIFINLFSFSYSSYTCALEL